MSDQDKVEQSLFDAGLIHGKPLTPELIRSAIAQVIVENNKILEEEVSNAFKQHNSAFHIR